MAAAAAKSSSGSAVRLMAAGWGLFTGSHLVMSHPPVREQLVSSLGGEKNFLGAYSLVSAATFFPTTFLYMRYARGVGVIPGWTQLTQSNPLVRSLGLGAKVGAAVTFGQGLATKDTAMDKAHGVEGTGPMEPQGIYRITRHPMFSAFAMLGLGNILLRGFTGDVVYWSGYILIWATGCPHQDYRLRSTGIVPQEYYDKTSFLPFAAIAEGRNSFQEAFKEFDKAAFATALVAPVFFL